MIHAWLNYYFIFRFNYNHCRPNSLLSDILEIHSRHHEGVNLTEDITKINSSITQNGLVISCHPAHCRKNIPYSLALRIIRNCLDMEDRDKRLLELKEMLLSCDYNKNVINAAIKKALDVPRSEQWSSQESCEGEVWWQSCFCHHLQPPTLEDHWEALEIHGECLKYFPNHHWWLTNVQRTSRILWSDQRCQR